MNELVKLIENLKKEKDFVNWGWGCQAIEIIEQKIENMKQDFPIRCIHSDSRTWFYVDSKKVMEWYQKYLGDIKNEPIEEEKSK